MKKRLARANKINARFAVILGEDELAQGVAQWRDLDQGAQGPVPLAELVGYARAAFRE
jgi:histidyl-tRNA synthetase